MLPVQIVRRWQVEKRTVKNEYLAQSKYEHAKILRLYCAFKPKRPQNLFSSLYGRKTTCLHGSRKLYDSRTHSEFQTFLLRYSERKKLCIKHVLSVWIVPQWQLSKGTVKNKVNKASGTSQLNTCTPKNCSLTVLLNRQGRKICARLFISEKRRVYMGPANFTTARPIANFNISILR